MPVQKDLKNLIRTRMQKTGESYTTARMHIVGKAPILPNYLELAPVGDDAVAAKTGKRWREWVTALDDLGAAGMLHKDIASTVTATWSIGGWWAQTVTIGYERIRGLRDVGQRRGKKEAGSYDANKSKTFPVAVSTLFAAFADDGTRARFLPAELTVRSATPDKSMRLDFPDGTFARATFWDKGPSKSSVQLQHSGLAGRPEVDQAKADWGERLDALAALLRNREQPGGVN